MTTATLEVRVMTDCMYVRWNIGYVTGGEHVSCAREAIVRLHEFVEQHSKKIHVETLVTVYRNAGPEFETYTFQLYDDADELTFVLKN